MAEELFWETLAGTVADGTSTSDALAEFRNESDSPIHIRSFDEDLIYNGAQENESATVELSKDNDYRFNNNDRFFRWPTSITIPPGDAAQADGGLAKSRTRLFARGQLVLEPNESLFMNVSKSSGGALSASVLIGYHFD